VVAKDGPKLKEAARDAESASVGEGIFSSPSGPIRATMPDSRGGAAKLDWRESAWRPWRTWYRQSLLSPAIYLRPFISGHLSPAIYLRPFISGHG
jgi:hypothetical protein